MNQPAERALPVVLFDGVCNLCSAWVTWILEHDRRAEFRFASLQSDAARTALAAAGAPTDLLESVVLIDEAGVHTRSDAVIRIARRLGFPGALVASGAIVPRALRDAMYDWVARNRYGWFGKQNACLVPTAELRSRFLDAGEMRSTEGLGGPATGAPDDDRGQLAPGAGTASPLGALGPLAHRFVLAHFLFYIFLLNLFPAGFVPGTNWLTTWGEPPLHRLVSWIAKILFGIKITVFTNGSGDTTYNYVELLACASLAIAVAIALTIVRRGRPVSAWAHHGISAVARYFVAASALAYGWLKVVPLQFPAPGPDRLIATFGDSSPMGLLWAFMGASTSYELFAGLAELLGGLLLLWRRTALLGAVVCVGVFTNIVVLNFSYDVPVKLYSAHLLLMSLFLTLPHLGRLAAVLVLELPAAPAPRRPSPIRTAWVRRALRTIGFVFAALLVFTPAFEAFKFVGERGAVRASSSTQGVFQVEMFSRNGILDAANPDSVRWVRVGVNEDGRIGIQRADGRSRRLYLDIDRKKRTFVVAEDQGSSPPPLSFSEPEPGMLLIQGPFEGVPIVVRMRRQPDGTSVLLNRGFHWINEYPFNR